ncbi:hypothetical protein A9Y76_07190 [Ralstonia insidiosa]|uniref:Uncharacterized protein n=1 Tax=Ralstonia insidiosa TaxID=190721 RepID=A0A191ZW04_9RALS|nr:hypothetical protein A9Y76_07190 [Ralstonia insidiosa]
MEMNTDMSFQLTSTYKTLISKTSKIELKVILIIWINTIASFKLNMKEQGMIQSGTLAMCYHLHK